MKCFRNKKMCLLLIVIVFITFLATNIINLNKDYKELANNNIRNSFISLISYSSEINNKIDEVLHSKEIYRKDLELIFYMHNQLIGEISNLQTTMEILGRNKVIQFNQFDVIQDLRVRVSKSTVATVKLDEMELNMLQNLYKICEIIKSNLVWESEDMLDQEKWITLISKVNDMCVEYLVD
ncbi:hypothetical protein [Acetoanaerobium sticklandii]|uniref:hypothetical protein n=1 Tax=Acetoanaerobium sticklandii TaxID=1511 RepID=UPI003A91CB43